MNPAIASLEIVRSADHGPASVQAVRFGSTGGTIGRSRSNHMCLPDPEQKLSRTHAQIVCRSGEVRILSRATNELVVDGVLIEFGEEVPLLDGARIEMGGYLLRASIYSKPKPSNSAGANSTPEQPETG